MSTILQLAPQNVWKHFYSLTQIPRPSGHMERITEFLVNFGKSLGLESFVDEVGNVIIRKPATPGMENRKGVETRRLRLEMPFAEKGSLIPSLLHAFRNIVQSRIEPVFKRIDPVMMAIGACHDSRAAGHGDRVRAKAVVKHAPLGRQAADILVLHVFAQYSSIDSPRLRGMIVGKDEKDVRASRVRFRLFVCHRRRGRRQKDGRDD